MKIFRSHRSLIDQEKVFIDRQVKHHSERVHRSSAYCAGKPEFLVSWQIVAHV